MRASSTVFNLLPPQLLMRQQLLGLLPQHL
jgi:hypothetical protein